MNKYSAMLWVEKKLHFRNANNTDCFIKKVSLYPIPGRTCVVRELYPPCCYYYCLYPAPLCRGRYISALMNIYWPAGCPNLLLTFPSFSKWVNLQALRGLSWKIHVGQPADSTWVGLETQCGQPEDSTWVSLQFPFGSAGRLYVGRPADSTWVSL